MRAVLLHKATVAGGVFILFAAMLTSGVDSAAAAPPQRPEWTRQFGTGGSDYGWGVAADATGIYVTGDTSGVFPGQTGAGDFDGYLRKYDRAGNVVWTRQFGTSGADRSGGVAVDSTGVYVTGSTDGVFPGQSGGGGDDGFVRKYDPEGNVVWTRQFGTSGSDGGHAVAVDSTGVYVTGVTDGVFSGQSGGGGDDGFVRKYDPAGNVVWTRQFGTTLTDHSVGVGVDSTGVYLTGSTSGVFLGQTDAGGYWDGFVRKYDGSGDEVWTRQFGTNQSDSSRAVAVGPTGIYVTGGTSGVFPGQTGAGWDDAFVRKYDSAGNVAWTRQFGTTKTDNGRGIGVDTTGVYIVGYTNGAFPGQNDWGYGDVFVRKYDSVGGDVWTRQFGTSSTEYGEGIAVDTSGLYLAGDTFGVFAGQPSFGPQDGFLRKYVVDHAEWCMGSAVTIAGTSNGETLEGTPGDDVIDAGDGDDTVHGGGGNDIICGGGGNDVLHGGPGSDRLVDSWGINTFHGGDGNDVIRAGGTSSEVYGEAGDDTVSTWAATGFVDGGAGNDDLNGSNRSETFFGGDGDDRIRPHDGLNEVYGGDGDDDIRAWGADRDQYIEGGPGNDSITADQGNDTLIGGPGHDVISGFKGDDVIKGGPGNDTLAGQQGNDTIFGGDGDDLITGWGGNDVLWGEGGDDTIQGGRHADVLNGGDGTDHIVGGSEDDVLDGGPGADTLNGREGNDELNGHDGDDLLKGGPGDDRLSGEAGDDDMRGANGNDVLWGGDGNDILRGHAMNDQLHGQRGNDLVHGGPGNDTLNGGDGIDTLNGGSNNDECTLGETYLSCELIL